MEAVSCCKMKLPSGSPHHISDTNTRTQTSGCISSLFFFFLFPTMVALLVRRVQSSLHVFLLPIPFACSRPCFPFSRCPSFSGFRLNTNMHTEVHLAILQLTILKVINKCFLIYFAVKKIINMLTAEDVCSCAITPQVLFSSVLFFLMTINFALRDVLSFNLQQLQFI